MLSIGGPLWGIAVLGMLAALLVVFALRLRRERAGVRAVVIGVACGLALVAVALLAHAFGG